MCKENYLFDIEEINLDLELSLMNDIHVPLYTMYVQYMINDIISFHFPFYAPHLLLLVPADRLEWGLSHVH